ncbi:MAG TPA: hypothetical protein VG347_14220 [Verrucomicrobiae bacterium]|nr:hypothetical protein [Verrucomicrobiae bacterium]
MSNRVCHSVGMATGKISRLPREIREQLNRQMDEGTPGKRLVGWLNGLPSVQALLASEFGGAAINEQNLTNWKQGGYRDWRMERQAQAFVPAPANGAVPPVMTLEQLATGVAIRHLLVVREWMESPMPVERRWRQMRVIVQDVLKLQRQGQAEKRVELDWERMQFAKERFEDTKQSNTRKAMVGFLVTARRWPEVQEALATAFRLFKERKETEGKEAELKPIKDDQGGTFKKEEAQAKSVNCSPLPAKKTGSSSPVAVTDGRVLVHHDGAHGVTRPTCTTVSKKLTTSSAVANVNWSQSGQIKDDQDGIFYPTRERNKDGEKIYGVMRATSDRAKIGLRAVESGVGAISHSRGTPQSMTTAARAITLAGIRGIAACQSHKVPAAQAKSVAARQTPPAMGCRMTFSRTRDENEGEEDRSATCPLIEISPAPFFPLHS